MIQVTKQTTIETTKQVAITSAEQIAAQSTTNAILGGMGSLGISLVGQSAISIVSAYASSNWKEKPYLIDNNTRAPSGCIYLLSNIIGQKNP